MTKKKRRKRRTNISQEPLCEYFKAPCHKHRCVRWINIKGIHPQTGETINEWNCAHNWVPILIIDVARQARNGVVATESFRNAVLDIGKIQNAKRLEQK